MESEVSGLWGFQRLHLVPQRSPCQVQPLSSPGRERPFQKGCQLLANQPSPNLRVPRCGDQECYRLAIGCGQAEHFGLLNLTVFLLREPSLGSLKSWQLLLCLGHVGPGGSISAELGMEISGVPSEVFEIATTVTPRFPYRHCPVRINLPKCILLLVP